MKYPSYDTPGPKPGSNKAVRQHQAMAQGYTVADTARKVDTFQAGTKTGCVHVPGLTNARSKKKG